MCRGSTTACSMKTVGSPNAASASRMQVSIASRSALRVVDAPHAAAATTGDRLHEQRVRQPDGGRDERVDVGRRLDRRQRRYAGGLGRRDRPRLVAGQLRTSDGRADERDAGVRARLGEGGVLRQEAVAGVDRVRTRPERDRDDRLGVEVGAHRVPALADLVGLVGLQPVLGPAVLVREHRHRAARPARTPRGTPGSRSRHGWRRAPWRTCGTRYKSGRPRAVAARLGETAGRTRNWSTRCGMRRVRERERPTARYVERGHRLPSAGRSSRPAWSGRPGAGTRSTRRFQPITPSDRERVAAPVQAAGAGDDVAVDQRVAEGAARSRGEQRGDRDAEGATTGTQSGRSASGDQERRRRAARRAPARARGCSAGSGPAGRARSAGRRAGRGCRAPRRPPGRRRRAARAAPAARCRSVAPSPVTIAEARPPPARRSPSGAPMVTPLTRSSSSVVSRVVSSPRRRCHAPPRSGPVWVSVKPQLVTTYPPMASAETATRSSDQADRDREPRPTSRRAVGHLLGVSRSNPPNVLTVCGRDAEGAAGEHQPGAS